MKDTTLTDSILVGPNRDPFFFSLVQMNVRVNYLDRTRGTRVITYEGHERDRKSETPLFTASLYVNCKGIIEDAIHEDPRTFGWQDVSSTIELEELLLREEISDGAHIVITSDKGMRLSRGKHVFQVDPKPIMQRQGFLTYTELLRYYLPSNFARYHATELDGRDIGSRTRHTLVVPILLQSGNAYSIKQTVYDHGGIGKTVRFGQHGLDAEFFLVTENELPSSLSATLTPHHYFDPQAKIVGILRVYPYENVARQVTNCREYLIMPSAIGINREKRDRKHFSTDRPHALII